eukprot:scaffold18272_cov217-Amphora_coffeaeformis.AAC.2
MDVSSVCSSDDSCSSLHEESCMDDDDTSSCFLEDELEPIAEGLNLGALLITHERYSESIEATQQVILLMKDVESRYLQQQLFQGEEDAEVLRVAPVYQPDKVHGQERGRKDAWFLYPFLVESQPSSLRALQAVAFYNLAAAYHLTQEEASAE